jgi:hypothetical protein
MNGRSPYRSQGRSRRHVRLRARGLVTIAAILIVGSIAASARFFEDATDSATNVAPRPDLPVVGEEGTGADESTSEGAHPKVYRHSVIPGGVHSARELAVALDTDAVARDHYKTVAADRVRVKTLDAPRQAYVSYRVGDQIYWTKEKVSLATGESILTDGNVEIRARCGNAISTQPNTPTSENEPPPPELDEVLDPPTRGFVPGEAILFLFPGLGSPPLAGDTSNPGATSYPGGGFFFPVSGGGGSSSLQASSSLPPYTWNEFLPSVPSQVPPVGGHAGGDGEGEPGDSGGYGDPGGGGDGDPQDPPPTGPPVAVPEPGTFLLLTVGAMSALARRLRRRSRP